nr:MAG TPA: hypothetical protein [Caudoviricetes sp.]
MQFWIKHIGYQMPRPPASASHYSNQSLASMSKSSTDEKPPHN